MSFKNIMYSQNKDAFIGVDVTKAFKNNTQSWFEKQFPGNHLKCKIKNPLSLMMSENV